MSVQDRGRVRCAVTRGAGARRVVLTHEIRLMQRCPDRTRYLSRTQSVTRQFQKGHHPRIYLLRTA